MDSREAHEAEVERLARAVGDEADRLRVCVRTATLRRRVNTLRVRASTQRAALVHDRARWQHDHEQAEIDRESRASARRMSDDLRAHSGPVGPTHWLP